MTLPEGFDAKYFYLNENENMYFAVLPEEKWINTTGSHDFDFAEMDMDINALGNQDSLWIRVENHWAAVDELQLTTGYHLATDRWWNVMISGDASHSIEADIRYYGAENQTNFFDPTFFTALFALGLNEDSLVLMFRPDPMSPWQEHGDFDLVTLPGLTNGTGRIHINHLISGEYCWAFKDPSNAVISQTKPTVTFTQMGEQIQIKSHNSNLTIGIFDASGRQVMAQTFEDGDFINLSNWPYGQYTIRTLEAPFYSLSIIHQSK
jgi:hypothetical protein